MSLDAVAVFAQVIPVLMIAAFLSSPRVGRDRVSRIVAIACMLAGAVAETTLLIFIAFNIHMDVVVGAVIIMITIYMLAAVVATAITKLEHDHKQDHERARE